MRRSLVKKPLLSLGMNLICTMFTAKAIALPPATVTEDSNVKWSEVVTDSFDGTLVYDKHYMDDFAFVSSWSRQGIRAAYIEKSRILTGYQTRQVERSVPHESCDRDDHHDHTKKRRKCVRWETTKTEITQKPVYKDLRNTYVPKKILFAIAGKIYTYESGPVSPEIAAALSSAPDQNMRIRLEWDTDRTIDMEIGKGTVRAWKTIFRSQK